MKKLICLSVLAFMVLTACGQKKQPLAKAKYAVAKTNAEWKSILSPNAYHIMVERGTEPPYKNAYHDNHEKGVYVSAATGDVLFSSEDKFDSGTGWPSFVKPVNAKLIKIITDRTAGMVRDEVVEAKTGLHLGHVFDDGPADRGGKRYCMNSGAFKFVKK